MTLNSYSLASQVPSSAKISLSNPETGSRVSPLLYPMLSSTAPILVATADLSAYSRTLVTVFSKVSNFFFCSTYEAPNLEANEISLDSVKVLKMNSI
jgi:hypothetical protein